MTERCRNCGAERLNQTGGKPERKCRRCGEYRPAPGSVIGPEVDTQFRGTTPYGKGIPLADIVAKINGEMV